LPAILAPGIAMMGGPDQQNPRSGVAPEFGFNAQIFGYAEQDQEVLTLIFSSRKDP
jgi:hypothetical protein